MARRGNGPGRGGPARGFGWGGPARGIGHNSGRAEDFAPGNAVATGPHSTHRDDRREEMIDQLYYLAMHSPSEAVQVAACIACLNCLLGPPKPMRRAGI